MQQLVAGDPPRAPVRQQVRVLRHNQLHITLPCQVCHLGISLIWCYDKLHTMHFQLLRTQQYRHKDLIECVKTDGQLVRKCLVLLVVKGMKRRCDLQLVLCSHWGIQQISNTILGAISPAKCAKPHVAACCYIHKAALQLMFLTTRAAPLTHLNDVLCHCWCDINTSLVALNCCCYVACC